MKIVLAGSPDISLGAFKEVIKNFDVVAIVTQPDKPRGRGMKLSETPVAKLGKENNIKVFKPEKIITISKELEELEYDLFLTFAYGQYIPEIILSQGKFPPLNIHGSLLPKYRGAAPIHYAILNGDNEIGITLIEMIDEMDAGDMAFKASQKIDENTTTGDGFEIVSNLAKNNIVAWLKQVENNNVKFEKQPKSFTLSPKIKKEFCELQSNMTKKEAIRKIRGLNPFPGAFVQIENKRIKIFNVKEKEIKNSIELKFIDGSLYATDYQYESKKRIILY